MAYNYRFYSGVRSVPLQFNVLGVRISMPAVILLLSDVVVATVLLVIFNQFLDGTPYTISFVIIAGIALGIEMTLFLWIVRLSRLGPLAVEKQFRLLKDTAQLPVWTGIEHIDANKKTQIR